jgi:hypothetical protein
MIRPSQNPAVSPVKHARHVGTHYDKEVHLFQAATTPTSYATRLSGPRLLYIRHSSTLFRTRITSFRKWNSNQSHGLHKSYITIWHYNLKLHAYAEACKCIALFIVLKSNRSYGLVTHSHTAVHMWTEPAIWFRPKREGQRQFWTNSSPFPDSSAPPSPSLSCHKWQWRSCG